MTFFSKILDFNKLYFYKMMKRSDSSVFFYEKSITHLEVQIPILRLQDVFF